MPDSDADAAGFRGRLAYDGVLGGEGPVWLPDGSLIVCEMAAQRVSRLWPDGQRQIIADVNGTPNGAAVGPDGKLWICNRGETVWREAGDLLLPDHTALDLYGGGAIERIDLKTGAVERVLTTVGGRELMAPNDLVFDTDGGLYFTDFGHTRRNDKDRGWIYYVAPGLGGAHTFAGPFDGPNGVGLSPDGQWLYVAESHSRNLWRLRIAAPGRMERSPTSPFEHGGELFAAPAGLVSFDSLAVDSGGYVAVAGVFAGAIYVFGPDGSETIIPVPDMAPTNICFGGDDLRTAYVTLATTGRVWSLEWPRPGLALAF